MRAPPHRWVRSVSRGILAWLDRLAVAGSTRPGRLPALVLGTGLALSALAGAWLLDDLHRDTEALFRHTVARVVAQLDQRFEQPVHDLAAAGGLYAVLGGDRGPRQLPHDTVGVRELAFEPRDALQGTAIDDPARRAAMARSVARGEPTLSTLLMRGESTPAAPGFWLCVPVYPSGQHLKGAADAATTFTSRPGEAPLGVMTAWLDVPALLAGLDDVRDGWVQFELVDGDTPLGTRVHASRAEHADAVGHASHFTAQRTLAVADRQMTVTVRSTAAFEHDERSWAPWVLAGTGALCSALVALLLWQQARGRQRAETLAHTMTADLDRLAVVAQQTSNAVLITDVRGVTTWVNAGFERITGYTAAEAIGRTPGSLLQCDATDRATTARIRAALDARRPFSGELLNRRKNGSLYWIDIDITPLHDAHGEMVGFSAIESDVTERKLAEAAQRASQAFLYTTGRIGGVGGLAFDLETQSLQWTDQACRILDLDFDHPPSAADCWALCTPEARAVLEAAIADGFAHGFSWDFELPMVTGKGRPIWVRLVAEGEFADTGPVRIVGALQDVTERRSMQAEVQRNALLLRGAIDAIDEAFVLYDRDDRLVFCNDKYRAIYATSADLIEPGMRFEDILRAGLTRGQYPDAIGREVQWLNERLAAHSAGDCTLVQQIDDGRVLRIVERRMPDGHLVGFRIDITDLVRARQAAERADRAKSEFIATISHELRTPLQSIMGFSELGIAFAKDRPPLDEMFTDIHQGGQRMLRLVNALLDVSKVDGTAARLALQRADLGALATHVMREMAPIAAERQVQLRLGTPEQPVPALPVLADPYRIEQVLRNVLANAVRFTAPGSTIDIGGCNHGPEGVTLTVRDHGPGIPPDELDQIFDAFVQSSRTRDGSGGTGLGLTICRKILRAHGGRIEAANAPDGGALMRLHLPALSQAPTLAVMPAAEPIPTLTPA